MVGWVTGMLYKSFEFETIALKIRFWVKEIESIYNGYIYKKAKR